MSVFTVNAAVECHLAEKQAHKSTVCRHPSHSLDVVKCDFLQCPNVGMTAKLKSFEWIQDIYAATMAQPKTLLELLQ